MSTALLAIAGLIVLALVVAAVVGLWVWLLRLVLAPIVEQLARIVTELELMNDDADGATS